MNAVKKWEKTDAHPWVGKPCGVNRLEANEPVPGMIEAVWRHEGDARMVVVDLDDFDEDLVTSVNRVEVL